MKLTKEKMKLIKEFIKTIDKDIKIRQSKKFECDIYEEKIYITTKKPQYFYDWLLSKIDFKPNWFIIAILHEVGHIMTNTEELQDNREMLYGLYSLAYKTKEINEKEINLKYFEIPAEYEATMWGVEFYKNNFKLCEEVAEMLGMWD